MFLFNVILTKELQFVFQKSHILLNASRGFVAIDFWRVTTFLYGASFQMFEIKAHSFYASVQLVFALLRLTEFNEADWKSMQC